MKIFGNKLLMKLMSTVTIFSMVLVSVYTPLDVYAEESSASIVSVMVQESSPNAIHVKGACKDVSAVLVQIYAGNDLVNMKSAYTTPVTGSARYNRSYDVTVEGSYAIGQKYTVYVTDYEGKLAAVSKEATISAATRDNDKYVSVDVSGRIGLVGYYQVPDKCKYLYIDGVMYDRADLPCDEYGYVRMKKYCSVKDLGEKLNVYALDNNELPAIPGSTPNLSVSVRDLQTILDDNYSSEGYSDKLKDFVKSTLDFGASVQRYFNYNVGELDSDYYFSNDDVGQLISDIEGDGTEVNDHGGKFAADHQCYLGQSMILGDTTTLRLYFKGDLNNYDVYVTGYDDYDFVTTNPGYCYVDIKNITPFDYNKIITVELAKKGYAGNVFNVSTSVNSYCKDVFKANGESMDGQYEELLRVLCYMQNYSKYCKAYFDNSDDSE